MVKKKEKTQDELLFDSLKKIDNKWEMIAYIFTFISTKRKKEVLRVIVFGQWMLIIFLFIREQRLIMSLWRKISLLLSYFF